MLNPADSSVGILEEAGFTEHVIKVQETAEGALKRILVRDETVVSEFSVLFPEKFMPKAIFYIYCVLTFGIYYLWTYMKAWCRKNKCCTPMYVQLQRGKMFVTSLGRVIIWNEFAGQLKIKDDCISCLFRICFPNLCAPPVHYAVSTQTKIYNVSNIRQVTEMYRSEACCGGIGLVILKDTKKNIYLSSFYLLFSKLHF